MPPAVQAGIYSAFTRSLDTVFDVAAVVLGVAFVLSFFLRDAQLRDTIGNEHLPRVRASSFLLEGAEEVGWEGDAGLSGEAGALA